MPALTILIATPVTLITVGPLTYWLGEELAIGVNWMFENGGVFSGIVYGGIYSSMVLLGIHHGMVPVLTQMLTAQGFNHFRRCQHRPGRCRLRRVDQEP